MAVNGLAQISTIIVLQELLFPVNVHSVFKQKLIKTNILSVVQPGQE